MPTPNKHRGGHESPVIGLESFHQRRQREHVYKRMQKIDVDKWIGIEAVH